MSVYLEFVLVVCVVGLLHASENIGACSKLSSTKKRMRGMQLAAEKKSACDLQDDRQRSCQQLCELRVCDERGMP